ncbi:MAG TPA: hypothetical protein VF518_14065, partial [Polyangia bacterium]
ASSGCLANRYTIPPHELARIAQLPPESRGNQVFVVQVQGERRAEAIDPDAPPLAPSDDLYAGEFADLGLQVGVNLAAEAVGGGGSPHAGGGWRSSGGGVSRPSAPPSAPWRSSGGGSSKSSSSSGGNGLGEAAAAVVIIVIAVIVLAAAGFAVNEGVRYDGAVQMFAGQPVHLKDSSGGERVVALGDLVPADATQSVKAEVMDDEGWGLRFIGRRPLDRKGFAFKLDMGSIRSLCACYSAAGFASNIQFGYFPHQRLGLLLNLTLGGGSDGLGNTFSRHSISGEAQWFPLNLWRVHLGAFGHGGVQIASESNSDSRTGPAFGGGLLLEIALTTRLALMARGDWTTARTAPDGTSWADTTLITGGLAIY